MTTNRIESTANSHTQMSGHPARSTKMLLENKNAVIYGEGGSIGGAVAREFSETFSWETLAAVDSKFQDEAALRGLVESLDGMRMTRRSPRLVEVAATAAFLASDQAGAITGTFINSTSGIFPS